MLLRISLIVAILASIGSLLVSHLQVAQKITDLETNLQNTEAQLVQTQQDLEQTRADLVSAKDLAEQTQKSLEQTTRQLAEMTKSKQQQQQRADRAELELNKTRTQLTAAQRDLAAWKALDIPVDEVRSRLKLLIKANAALTALQEENAVMLHKINQLKERLMVYEGETLPPVEMPGLKGRVIAVDPKWDFVVLDVGGKQGALPRGEMLVSRDGKLVGKIRITRVEDNRCIANVLPEWKQADVQVGDLAMY
jgi:outer membrane murein-binding lipoprotein Lpp